MKLADLIQEMNVIAGKHGVGRIDHVENRLVGIKSREIYECPGAIALLTAHKEIEDLTLVREVSHFKPFLKMNCQTLSTMLCGLAQQHKLSLLILRKHKKLLMVSLKLSFTKGMLK